MKSRRVTQPRYPLQLPVRYRSSGEEAWQSGTTRNIGPTGLTIVSNGPVAAGEPIAVVVTLPEVSGCLRGRGRVVDVDSSAFAVAVKRFTIDRRG